VVDVDTTCFPYYTPSPGAILQKKKQARIRDIAQGALLCSRHFMCVMKQAL
jgi:hypothetical protein